MISVIKNGKEKTYYARCNKCASELEYMHSDVKFECSTAYPNQRERFITCPVCGETIPAHLQTKTEYEKSNEWPHLGFGGARY